MTNNPKNNQEEVKEKIYDILNKMYADKEYIDVVYEDIVSLLRTEKSKWARELLEKVGEDEVYDENGKYEKIANMLDGGRNMKIAIKTTNDERSRIRSLLQDDIKE